MGQFCNMCTRSDVDNQACIKDDSEAEKPRDRRERKARPMHDTDEIPSEITYDNTTTIIEESAQTN